MRLEKIFLPLLSILKAAITGLIIILISTYLVNHGTKMPIARQGVLDLSSIQFSENTSINLDGEWEFYWDRLLTPNDFHTSEIAPALSSYFVMPRPWKGFQLGEQRLPATGKATFRLQLLPGDKLSRIDLRLFDIHEAYRLWANGELVAQSGSPGSSAATELPARSLALAEIPVNGLPVELILQVSNYHFRSGGVTEPIAAASPGTLQKIKNQDRGIALFFTGCILIIGLYHLAIFTFRRNNLSPLYFTGYCFLVVGYTLCSNTSQWAIYSFFPKASAANLENFSLLCYVSWEPLLFRFLASLYPDEFHYKLVYLLDARILFFVLFLMLAPGVPLYWFIAFCLLQMMIYASYYLQRIMLCIKRKRSGARFLLLGLSAQFLVGFNDILTHAAIIQSIYLAIPVVSLFAFCQSLALAQQFTSTFTAVEYLSLQLERKNRSLQKEIEDNIKLEQKIVHISDQERRNISHELHDGLCQQLTGARLRASALATKFKGSEDEKTLSDLLELLKQSTDDAYKTSRGLWPVEHNVSGGGPSIAKLIQTISEKNNIKILFNQSQYCKTCSNTNMTNLYRIAQEALTNAVKHSQAAQIDVDMYCNGDGKSILDIRDNGVGQCSSKAKAGHGGLGMSIMSHRAKLIDAQLNITDAPGGGTQITCIAPCACLK